MGRRHAENLAFRVPGVELVAACSPIGEELEWARDTLGVARLYKDYNELLAHPGLDAVFLVTPVTLHPTQIIAGLQAGKHVFCEKPLSLDLNECLQVEAEAARHPHLKVMIGFVRRFDASYQDAQKSIAAGAIGRPFMVRSETCDQNDPSGFFVRFAPTSGGIFVDMSVHDIDLARWLLGSPRPLRVFSVGAIAIHEGLRACGDVDNGVAMCEFADGRMACFYASRTMAHGHETATEIIGTDGRLTVPRWPPQPRRDLRHARRALTTPRSTSASPTRSSARAAFRRLRAPRPSAGIDAAARPGDAIGVHWGRRWKRGGSWSCKAALEAFVPTGNHVAGHANPSHWPSASPPRPLGRKPPVPTLSSATASSSSLAVRSGSRWPPFRSASIRSIRKAW
jgi:myo-inositol 2-dehydrogenase/D-chiro-inositol 1-dehydrogenase